MAATVFAIIYFRSWRKITIRNQACWTLLMSLILRNPHILYMKRSFFLGHLAWFNDYISRINRPFLVSWIFPKCTIPINLCQNNLCFRQSPRRPGFNPRSVHTRDSKMVLDASLLNAQHYKVLIKGKLEQFREKNWSPPLHLGVVAIEEGAIESP